MKKHLLYIIVSVLALFACSKAAAADTANKSLCFVYIAKSEMTAKQSLAEYLDLRYKKAMSDQNFVLVVYMAGEDGPSVVEINTPDDNRESYPALLEAIKGSECDKVYPDSDVSRLVVLFEKLKMMSPDYEIQYDFVDWHFHVTSDFWKMGYNESLISSLCFVMGVDHLDDANFRLRCYFSRYDEFEYDEAFPFGKKNYCNLEFRPYYY